METEISNFGAPIRLKIEKGTYFPLVMYPEDANGTPTDLTGYTGVRLTIRASDSETETALVVKTGTISAPSSSNDTGFSSYWKVAIPILPTDTNYTDFADLTGHVKIEILNASGYPEPFASGPVVFGTELDQQ